MRTIIVTSTLEKHLASPDVTTEAHVRAKMVSLGELMLERKRVYFDTKFWILLRNAELGSNDEAVSLLRTLRTRVAAKQLVCPIEPSVFLEMMKQSDAKTRIATARVIDDLSLGTCLVHPSQRIKQELCEFVYSSSGVNDRFHLDELVWTKVSYILGITHPSETSFDSATEKAIQKAFFDHMWEISLEEIVTTLGDRLFPKLWDERSASRLNRANAAHAHEVVSFERTYRSEFIGLLDIFCEDVGEMILSRSEAVGGIRTDATDSQRMESGRSIMKIIDVAIRKHRPIVKTLRTAHIGALCHAAIRKDKARSLTGNDLHDFHHAQAAVGYCDAFFTDKPLHALLSQRRLGLAADFDCAIGSDLPSLEEWLASAVG